MYQEKAWYDVEMIKEWISNIWGNPFKNPIGQNSDGKILIANVDCVQQTNSMKEVLKEHKTSPVNVPLGCTPHVQVVDILINKPFEDEVHSLFEDDLDKNLNQYVADGKINASQRKVLMTKWVGKAWSKVGKMKDFIICFFKKCGLSVALDGSEKSTLRVCRNIKCHNDNER